MATEAQILANRRNSKKSTGPHSQKVLEIRSVTLFLCAFVPYALVPSFLYNCRELFTNQTFIMQNEPNLPKAQMNVNKVLTKDYENKPNWTLGENEPKTNPIKPNL